MRIALRAAMVAAVFLCAARANAAGGVVHIFMSERAIDHVQNEELKSLIAEQRNVLLWASWYPDSGYPGGNEYGEHSHWSPFLNGYLEYIRDEIGPEHSDYRMLVAHLLGAASHGMEDQVFDQIFLDKTQEVDASGQETLDFGLDVICMYDYKRDRFNVPLEVMADNDKYTPVAHLLKVYEKQGMNYRDIEGQILRGQSLLATGMSGVRTISRLFRQSVKKRSPWAVKHYYEAPGGVEHNAKIIAAYWEALWERLNGRPDDFVLATFPEDGAAIPSTDHTTVDSSIAVFFSRKYDRATVNGDTFIVADAGGKKIDGDFQWGYGSNVLKFAPAADLSPGTEYRVRLTKEILDEKGAAMGRDFVFGFITK